MLYLYCAHTYMSAKLTLAQFKTEYPQDKESISDSDNFSDKFLPKLSNFLKSDKI